MLHYESRNRKLRSGHGLFLNGLNYNFLRERLTEEEKSWLGKKEEYYGLMTKLSC